MIATIQIGLNIKPIISRLSGHLFFFLTEEILENLYLDISSYVKELLEKQNIKLEVKIIKDILFIEKIEFLIAEQHKSYDIMMELLGADYLSKLLKSFSSEYLNESLVPIYTRFYFQVKEGRALIYLLWKDSNGNIIFVEGGGIDKIKILDEGDTYTLQ